MSEEAIRRAIKEGGGSLYVWEIASSMGYGEEVARALWSMRESGEIDVRGEGRGFAAYMLSPASWWAWLALLGVALGVVAALLVPHSPVQLEFIKVAMGAPSLFYIPGLALVRALYPEWKWKGFDEAALAIAMSLSLLPIIGITLVTIGVDLTVNTTLISVDGLSVALILVAAARRASYEEALRRS
ncbi:hypothetical protein ASAC_1351 [Acidilobus saccharovorans 345-15]|uniref:DUF1616 domain-containing protein n=1 Tax=Acidilobus saccharovorans (strain DSM 16705 / JCM 18335 / VKM B-2471 / 345-15) TaxID=666510 RepID=D9Q368_ACIS3|nr:DUF1616 domain-containing protein [Acidilobus saccharovorans]ADL19756.1 hypothetical protein ASAC_1351 [Acidilobus saccharovorans 345-15]